MNGIVFLYRPTLWILLENLSISKFETFFLGGAADICCLARHFDGLILFCNASPVKASLFSSALNPISYLPSQVTVFISRLNGPSIGLTAMDLFTLDKSMVLTVSHESVF
jgi:hypothetical protein